MGMPSIIGDEYDRTTISQKRVSNAPMGADSLHIEGQRSPSL